MTSKVFFRAAAWLLVLAIAVFTLSPIWLRPITGLSAHLERFVAFAIIGVCFGLGYPKHRLAILVMVIGIVGALEVSQNLIPGRHGHLRDSIVKMAGALLGLTAAAIIERKKVVHNPSVGTTRR